MFFLETVGFTRFPFRLCAALCASSRYFSRASLSRKTATLRGNSSSDSSILGHCSANPWWWSQNWGDAVSMPSLPKHSMYAICLHWGGFGGWASMAVPWSVWITHAIKDKSNRTDHQSPDFIWRLWAFAPSRSVFWRPHVQAFLRLHPKTGSISSHLPYYTEYDCATVPNVPRNRWRSKPFWNDQEFETTACLPVWQPQGCPNDHETCSMALHGTMNQIQ